MAGCDELARLGDDGITDPALVVPALRPTLAGVALGTWVEASQALFSRQSHRSTLAQTSLLFSAAFVGLHHLVRHRKIVIHLRHPRFFRCLVSGLKSAT